VNKLHQSLGLAGWLLITFAAAALGSFATTTSVGIWYHQISRPTWTPPDWIFGPVWIVLYLMMATSAWLVWRSAAFNTVRLPLGLFLVQLALNAFWSVLFFGLKRPDLAAAEIVLLWLAILATLITFWNRSTAAGWLLVPYLAWVTFAALLNFAIARLNC
jgi:benzodiazapine receptor